MIKEIPTLIKHVLALSVFAAVSFTLGPLPAWADSPPDVPAGAAAKAPVAAIAGDAAAAKVPELPQDLSKYKEEPVPGGSLLVIAYGVMWLLLLAFVGRLASKQRQTQAQLRALEDRLIAGTATDRAGGQG